MNKMITRTPPGVLYLIPVPLGESGIDVALPLAVSTVTSGLKHFVVEHPKTARHFLKQIGTAQPLQSLNLEVLDEHTPANRLTELLIPLLEGNDIGLMSEAGCPGIADPGAALIALAHKHDIPVRPLVGPSSILLSLMASGLDGQRFAFHGYLPVEKSDRSKRLIELEKTSARLHQTQIFIETPYRNNVLLADLLSTLQPRTRLCIAVDITLPSESIRTKATADWRKSPPDLNKRPAVFLLLA